MVPHEKMIHSYLQLRDQKQKLVEQHKEEVKKYNDAMLLIENYLKDYLSKNNLQNIASGEATAFLQRERKATVADMGTFREFVIANGNFELADMRAKVDAVEDYVTEHEGRPPPGINFSTSIHLRVQRK